MNVFVKSIRKLMGWCPNAKNIKAGSQVSSANFEAYDRSEGEKTDRSRGEKTGNTLSHMKRIGLLLTSIGAFISALTLVLEIQVVSTSNEILISPLMIGIGALLFLIGITLYIRS